MGNSSAPKKISRILQSNAPRNVDELPFTSRDESGRIVWWDVVPPRTNYWEAHATLGKAYALDLLDLIDNPNKSEPLNERTFGFIAAAIAREGTNDPRTLGGAIVIGFFNCISEYLISGRTL